MTWDEVRTIGLALPGVEDATSYGTPALKVRAGSRLRLLTRLKEDGLSVVLHVDAAEKELLLEADPERFFQTAHYEGHPLVLARLSTADAGQVGAMLERTWRDAAPRALLALRGAERRS